MSPKIHPSAAVFGSLECCALRKVTQGREHGEYIKAFIARVQPTTQRYQVSVLAKIFEKTTRLVFVPGLVHQTFYTELALREKDLLFKKENVSLDCGHSAHEHIVALDSIATKMIYPQGNN